MSLPRRTRPGRVKGERQRRDPRAERQAPDATAIVREPVAAPARTRRDPRAERGPADLPGGKPRMDRARPLRLVEEIAAPERPAPAGGPEAVIIDNPAFWVLAVPDLAGGRLSDHDRAVLGAARQLADAGGGAVVALTFTPAADLGAAGADRVMPVAGDDGCYAPERQAAAICAAMDGLKPRHLVFAESAAGADLGRRIAARLGELPATRIQVLSAERVLCRGDGDSAEFERAPPRILLVDPDAAAGVSGKVYEARPLDTPDECGAPARITDAGELPVDPAAVPLAEADLIVSAGNGVSDWPAFHALAVALGASEGGSRPVCDAGALARDRQVGASGTLVSARGYLALGISGAPQHLQGIADCEHVIAVNADPHAEILKRADLGIVADVQEVMPALIDLLNGRGEDRA
jgi:electron transfer flavoprotein alpha subunit